MAKKDYYEVLGVNRDVDIDEIKRAYRNLAMKYHPDRNPEPQAAEQMKEINEAYAVLSNTEKRRLYDVYGHAGLEGYSQEDIFRSVDFSSLFRDFGFGGDGSIFDTLFGGRTTTARGRRKGTDLRYDLTVTLEEVASGTEKTVEFTRVEPCPVCGGSGAAPGGVQTCDRCKGTGQLVREQRSGYSVFRQISTCDKCRGTGRITKEACKECKGKGSIEKAEALKVKIPAGAETGYTVKIEGAGEKDTNIPGDLYVILDVAKHPLFERHGDDIYVQKEINFTTAALGGKVKAPGLKADVEIHISEGTQTGSVFRINDAGIPHLNRRGRGDEYVVVKVVTPTHLTSREKEILKEFDTLQSDHDKKDQD